MSKDLVFKVVLQADNKDYVSNVKQSEDVTKAVVKAIKDEADKLRQTSTDTAKEIGNLVPESTTKMASALTQNLTNATTAIKGAGTNAAETAKNFAEFGRVSEKALGVLKSDLDQAKQKLQALSSTNATPQDIAHAQAEVDKLEKEVIQADHAFNQFTRASNQANQELKQTSNIADKTNASFSTLRSGATLLVGALAAIGVGLSIKELGEAADSYAMLSARIQQTTKDTGNFEQAIASVHKIALQTNSSLDATTSLFTKLNTVAKDMGQTQQYALDMTSTVTKAIQLGGGSAQASEAAVQQFIQAMQGGVLRGEEFNSIMENGYGLAEALAKGLGVTTGELRKMAEAGELSAERVLGALSKQKTAVDAQYAELPLTIGNALQKIASSWQILIGEMDQANGASATVAQWLSTLADNLDVVEVLLRDIGSGFVWFGDQLKRIDTQTIEALKTALLSAYEAVKSLVATISTGFEVTIDLLNTTLGQLLSFSSGIDSAADKTNGFTKALQALNVVFGFLKDGFSGVSIAGSLLVGMFYSMAAAWEKVKSKFTWGETKNEILQEMAELEAKSTEWFNRASNDAVKFKSAGIEAIRQIGLTQAEKDTETVASSKATLDKLLLHQNEEVEGKKAAEGEKLAAVQKYAELAIKANGGVIDGTMQADLMTKGYIVTLDEAGKVAVSAWDAVAAGANKTSNEIDKARKAATALGIDLDVSLNRVSEKFEKGRQNVDDFVDGLNGLGAQGKQAADLTYDAWSKWLETAKSQAEIDAAKAKLKEFEAQGVFSTKQVEMGMLAIKQATAKLPDDLDEVGKAFDRLGIKTKEQLKLAAQSAIADFNTIKASGKATSEGLKQAYERVMQAAAASGDQAVIANAKAQGASVGLQAQIDETGKSSVQSTQEIVDSLYKVGETARGSAADGFRELGRVAREEAKSTADEWIDAMASVDAARKAKDASNNKGLSELQGGIDQMAQDYYDRLVAAGMDQSRARDLADKTRYSLAVETTTSLKGGTTQNMNTTKQEMEKTLAYWENRNSSKSGSGSVSTGNNSPSIQVPSIQAPSIESPKMPN
ncbi:tape measure protein, partial [Acinetobacter venetianus]|uniref:tape measure protein n=1 Tax=Acinetobacter venetianus TaxID=52133 RepID=UPI003A8CB6C6